MLEGLPIDALSNSSMNTLAMCGERWRRRYLEREYEPPTGSMTIGSTVGAAEAQSDHTWIESGEPLSTESVLDVHADEWNLLDLGEIDWQGKKPIEIRESGEAALRAYHDTVVPESAAPVDAERRIEFEAKRFDGESVPFVAYLDVELVDGTVIDRKVKGKKLTQADADADPQPTAYMLGRRAEGNPASGFAFDAMNRGVKTPYAERVATERSDAQLDEFLNRILSVAEEIDWRAGSENWSYAPPGSWWCGEKFCGYWSSCPGGGLLRKRAARAARESEIAAMVGGES